MSMRVWNFSRYRRYVAMAAALGVAGLLWQLGSGRPAPVAGPSGTVAVYKVATTRKAVALCINVVWGTQYVTTLVHELVAAHQKATFFLGGAWAEANPALVRDIVAAGMQVANHGYAHRHQNSLSFDENVAEIAKASRAIEVAGAPRPKLFSPPYGEYDATVLAAASALHLPLIMWTIDTIDWRPSSSVAVIEERVARRIAPGAIVLMHPTDRTAQALPGILRMLQAKGYRAVTVSTLLTLGPPLGDG